MTSSGEPSADGRPPSPIPPLVGATAQVRVELWMRRMIVAGTWPVGSRIPAEPRLMHQLGVSRATIRHAVGVLARIGVLEVGRGTGTHVRAVSPVSHVLGDYLHDTDLTDIVELREAIERRAAELAAVRRTDSDIGAMTAAIECAAGEFHVLIHRHIRDTFSTLMVRSTANPLLIDTHAGLMSALRTHRDGGQHSPQAVSQRVLTAQLRAILQAIERGDPERARAACVAQHDHERAARP